MNDRPRPDREVTPALVGPKDLGGELADLIAAAYIADVDVGGWLATGLAIAADALDGADELLATSHATSAALLNKLVTQERSRHTVARERAPI